MEELSKKIESKIKALEIERDALLQKEIREKEEQLINFATDIKKKLIHNQNYSTESLLSKELKKYGIRARIHYELINN